MSGDAVNIAPRCTSARACTGCGTRCQAQTSHDPASAAAQRIVQPGASKVALVFLRGNRRQAPHGSHDLMLGIFRLPLLTSAGSADPHDLHQRLQVQLTESMEGVGRLLEHKHLMPRDLFVKLDTWRVDMSCRDREPG
jgi:hypothetical protein